MDEIELVLISDDNERELLTLAEDSGLRPIEDAASTDFELDPLTMTLLIGGALMVGRFLISVMERSKGGVRIDLATRPPTVERLRDVPYGVILVFTADDEVRIETVD